MIRPAGGANGGINGGGNGNGANSNGANGNGDIGNGANGGVANGLEAPHKQRARVSLRHRAADKAVLSFWRTGSWLLGHLPAAPAYAVAGWLMLAGYYLVPDRRRWLRANYGHVLGLPPNDPRVGRTTRAAYRNYARYIVELMRLPWLSRERCENRLEVRDLDRALRILAESNGIVFAGAHLGNNEAAAAGFVKNGLPVTVVGDDSAYGGLYGLLERQRNSWGVQMVGWRNLRGCYRVLQRKEILGLLIDWGYRSDGVPVRLFGHWTTLPEGPAFLAGRHRSTILPFSVQRMPDDRLVGQPDEPIYIQSVGPADIQRATQEIAYALERAIARAPDQWYIFKPIWPDSEAEERKLEARAAEMQAGRKHPAVTAGAHASQLEGAETVDRARPATSEAPGG